MPGRPVCICLALTLVAALLFPAPGCTNGPTAPDQGDDIDTLGETVETGDDANGDSNDDSDDSQPTDDDLMHMMDVVDAGSGSAEPGHCTNEIQDMRESDVDCGGPGCPKCDVGQACGLGLDCHTGLCQDGLCAALDETTPDGDLIELSCTNYCQTLQETCGDAVDVNGQFFDEDECLGYCVAVGWEAGAADALTGNTLGCRLNHAHMAAATTDPDLKKTLCDTAGASGGGVCGSWCAVLCESHLDLCTGENQQYVDRTSCLDACAGLTDEPDGSYRHADPTYLYYDTVQCRIRHLRSAVEHSATVHCPHTSESSAAGACDDDDVTGTPNCAHYCDMMRRYCDGGSWTDCQTECIALYHMEGGGGNVGTHADFTGDTLGCRINQAEFARDCASADIDGGTVCTGSD